MLASLALPGWAPPPRLSPLFPAGGRELRRTGWRAPPSVQAAEDCAAYLRQTGGGGGAGGRSEAPSSPTSAPRQRSTATQSPIPVWTLLGTGPSLPGGTPTSTRGLPMGYPQCSRTQAWPRGSSSRRGRFQGGGEGGPPTAQHRRGSPAWAGIPPVLLGGRGWFWRSHFNARQPNAGGGRDSSGPEAKSRRPAPACQ